MAAGSNRSGREILAGSRRAPGPAGCQGEASRSGEFNPWRALKMDPLRWVILRRWCWRRGCGQGLGFEPVAVAVEGHGIGVVNEPVGGGGDVVSEGFGPNSRNGCCSRRSATRVRSGRTRVGRTESLLQVRRGRIRNGRTSDFAAMTRILSRRIEW